MIFLKIKDMFIKIVSETQNLLLFQGLMMGTSYQIIQSFNFEIWLGEEKNSFCTPRGMHIIRAMIGHNCPINTHLLEEGL